MSAGWLTSLALMDVLGWAESPSGCPSVCWLQSKLGPSSWVTKEFLLPDFTSAAATGTILQSLALKRQV